MNPRMTAFMHLLQMSDSAFPVGSFSFSNGLETAAHTGVVHDASTLETYVRTVVRQATFTDGVAALCARRAMEKEDYDALVEADHCLWRCKLNEESRLMLSRMGRKLAELAVHLFPHPLLRRWLDEVVEGVWPGTYPVAQGMTAFLAGFSGEELFCLHQYGAANMVLGAALRCVRVSHYDTQAILFRLGEEVPALYEAACQMTLEEMHTFAPQMDILASLHEKGNMRMFMN